ncbi:hypothetical protein [Halobacillus seohaensis]|uniref:hypothetical protein n=1 Tax=Halobacillus seohaensis TaxID=447421 RepID=UPI0036F38564
MNLITSLKEEWTNFDISERKRIIHTLFGTFSIECLQSHKGGKGQKAVIEIADYSLKLRCVFSGFIGLLADLFAIPKDPANKRGS